MVEKLLPLSLLEQFPQYREIIEGSTEILYDVNTHILYFCIGEAPIIQCHFEQGVSGPTVMVAEHYRKELQIHFCYITHNIKIRPEGEKHFR